MVVDKPPCLLQNNTESTNLSLCKSLRKENTGFLEHEEEQDKHEEEQDKHEEEQDKHFHEIFHTHIPLSRSDRLKTNIKLIYKPVLSSLKKISLQHQHCLKIGGGRVSGRVSDATNFPNEWSFDYKFTAQAVRTIMHKMGNMANPNIHYLKQVSETKNVLPLKAKLVENQTVKVQDSVISFLKSESKNRFVWPDVAEEKKSIYAETVCAFNGKVEHTRVLYNVHGGAFVIGSAQLYRRMAYFLSKAAKAACFSINYRLAPSYPFPCAIIDVVSGYLHLLKKYKPENIILAGDSAGGNLVLAAMMVIRDMDIPKPAGMYLQSPWVDLNMTFESWIKYDGIDVLPNLPTSPILGSRMHYYAANKDLQDPYVSPYRDHFNDFHVPIMLQVGTVEKLYDDSVALAEKLKGALIFESYENHIHVFQQLRSVSVAAKIAHHRAGDWMQQIYTKTFDVTKQQEIQLDFFGNLISQKEKKTRTT